VRRRPTARTPPRRATTLPTSSRRREGSPGRPLVPARAPLNINNTRASARAPHVRVIPSDPPGLHFSGRTGFWPLTTCKRPYYKFLSRPSGLFLPYRGKRFKNLCCSIFPIRKRIGRTGRTSRTAPAKLLS
jgi:hypothetical protein